MLATNSKTQKSKCWQIIQTSENTSQSSYLLHLNVYLQVTKGYLLRVFSKDQ